ncbi:MAG: hypothetical protein ACYT04_44880 [Nostoc sp.]
MLINPTGGDRTHATSTIETTLSSPPSGVYSKSSPGWQFNALQIPFKRSGVNQAPHNRIGLGFIVTSLGGSISYNHLFNFNHFSKLGI